MGWVWVYEYCIHLRPTHPVFLITDYLSLSYSYIFLELLLRASFLASNRPKPIEIRYLSDFRAFINTLLKVSNRDVSVPVPELSFGTEQERYLPSQQQGAASTRFFGPGPEKSEKSGSRPDPGACPDLDPVFFPPISSTLCVHGHIGITV